MHPYRYNTWLYGIKKNNKRKFPIRESDAKGPLAVGTHSVGRHRVLSCASDKYIEAKQFHFVPPTDTIYGIMRTGQDALGTLSILYALTSHFRKCYTDFLDSSLTQTYQWSRALVVYWFWSNSSVLSLLSLIISTRRDFLLSHSLSLLDRTIKLKDRLMVKSTNLRSRKMILKMSVNRIIP